MDLDLELDGDLILTAAGDFNIVTGYEEALQAIMRLLFTTPQEVLPDGTQVFADYIFDTDYGLGIARLVGGPSSAAFRATFAQKVQEAVFAQEGVDTSQAPVINYYQQGTAFYVQVNFTYINGSQGQGQLVFPLP